MRNLVIYHENNIEIKKKIKYYKKLGINAVLIDPFKKVDEEIIEKILSINEILSKYEIRLIVKVNLAKISSMLLNLGKIANWENPKIRKSFYQFINYLKKYGVKGFYFYNFEELFASNTIFYLRELGKNTLLGENIMSIGKINSDDISYQEYLANDKTGIFSYIYNESLRESSGDFLDRKSYLSTIQNQGINEIFTSINFLKDFTNSKNFPFLTSSLLAGVSFLLNGGIILENFEELGIFESASYTNDYKVLDQTNKTFDFYQKLIRIKTTNQAITKGKYRQIFNKDSDIFAFVRTYKDQKVIVFANFSQKEVLADIRFHFIDINDFAYLLGNYGRRRIVKNLLLRPYEFIAFVK